MGFLIYGVAPAIRIEDRVLRHLQAVIIAKLRRGETFAFNWDQEPGVEGAESGDDEASHGTIWISSASQLYFRYDGSRVGQLLNRHWLEVLMKASNSASGLYAAPEPDAESHAHLDHEQQASLT
jgi:hypothetical protein